MEKAGKGRRNKYKRTGKMKVEKESQISAYDYVTRGKEVPPKVHKQTIQRSRRVTVQEAHTDEGLTPLFPDLVNEPLESWLK